MNDSARSYDVYAFDAYGTLFDVHSAVMQVARGLGETAQALSNLWRQRQLEYTWVRTLSGCYRDFEAITEDALEFALKSFGIDDKRLQALLMLTYNSLSPYPEVRRVLLELRARGKKVVVFSNGTPRMIRRAVQSAGLEPLFDEVISTHSARAFKTRTDVYGLVCDRLEVDRQAVSFQSSNRWDIAGAASFGFRTVWVNRDNQPDEYMDLSPDAEITTLADLTDELAAEPQQDPHDDEAGDVTNEELSHA